MDLKGRHFLKLLDYTPEEISYLLDLAADLKEKKKQGIPVDRFRGKNIALIFEKTSTRTRCSFEVAAHDLGLGTTYLDPSGSQIGKKESIADTARVLGRMYEGIEYRGYGQDIVEELAACAGVPGRIASAGFAPDSAIIRMVSSTGSSASRWNEMISAPASRNCGIYFMGWRIIRCTSNGRSVHRRIDAITGIPMEILGTNSPSMISRWTQSAPARLMESNSSPSREKSDASIDGATNTKNSSLLKAEPSLWRAAKIAHSPKISASPSQKFFALPGQAHSLKLSVSPS